MKAKSNYKDKKFEPVEVTITIENESELIELYARANISRGALDSVTYENKPIKYTGCNSIMPLFNELDRICRRYFG